MSPTTPPIRDCSAPDTADIHPALRTFADEFNAVAVRIMAYVSGLAILAVIAVDFVSTVPVSADAASPAARGWTAASRPHPAFAISKLDLSDRTYAYRILRHPEGGRKDVLRWAADAGEPAATEIEIYRPGNELDAFSAADIDLSHRLSPGQSADLEPAGLIDTKFGPVPLFRVSGATPAGLQACLGFTKSFEAPRMRFSGWSCQADSLSAQRTFISCTLNRLTLLSAGNDPKVAELFAHAELKRHSCNMTPTTSASWIASGDAPQLRGPMPN